MVDWDGCAETTVIPWRTSVEDKQLTCWDWNFGFKLGIKLGFILPDWDRKSPPKLPKTTENQVTEGLGSVLGGSWGNLEASWALLETFRASWRDLGGILGGTWGILEGFWSLLESFWSHLGASWEVLGRFLGGLGSFLGDFWEILEIFLEDFLVSSAI